jgi:head-tail adaptor
VRPVHSPQQARRGNGMTDPGQRDTLVTFQRGTLVSGDYGDTLDWTTPTTLGTAYARVRYGTGQERREAAQERAVQAATFECDWSPTLDAVQTNDRLFINEKPSEFWDIISPSPLGHKEIHFAGVRSS